MLLQRDSISWDREVRSAQVVIGTVSYLFIRMVRVDCLTEPEHDSEAANVVESCHGVCESVMVSLQLLTPTYHNGTTNESNTTGTTLSEGLCTGSQS